MLHFPPSHFAPRACQMNEERPNITWDDEGVVLWLVERLVVLLVVWEVVAEEVGVVERYVVGVVVWLAVRVVERDVVALVVRLVVGVVDSVGTGSARRCCGAGSGGSCRGQ